MYQSGCDPLNGGCATEVHVTTELRPNIEFHSSSGCRSARGLHGLQNIVSWSPSLSISLVFSFASVWVGSKHPP